MRAKMKSISTFIATLGATCLCSGVPFESLNLSQNVEANALDAINATMENTNGISFIKSQDSRISGIPESKMRTANGITFDIYEDGEVRFFFDETDDPRDPLDKILVNNKKMSQVIQEKIDAGDMDKAKLATSNTILEMTYNPLWGKKLAVIGDSLTCSPGVNQSYSFFIAQRNNMVLVNKGRGGEKLCVDRTNELGQVTNISTIKSYTNDIPSDADFILV